MNLFNKYKKYKTGKYKVIFSQFEGINPIGLGEKTVKSTAKKVVWDKVEYSLDTTLCFKWKKSKYLFIDVELGEQIYLGASTFKEEDTMGLGISVEHQDKLVEEHITIDMIEGLKSLRNKITRGVLIGGIIMGILAGWILGGFLPITTLLH